MRSFSILLFLFFSAAIPASETIRIDSAHSHANFAVRMLWLRQVEGRIDDLHGTVDMDDSGYTRVSVSINVAEVRMDKPRYEAMLRSEDFFDTEHYPTIRFRSDAFDTRFLHDGGEIVGMLTMRGVSRAVRLTVLPAQCETAQITDCPVRVRGMVERSQYGMNTHRITMADHVQLRLTIRLEKAQSMTPES